MLTWGCYSDCWEDPAPGPFCPHQSLAHCSAGKSSPPKQTTSVLLTISTNNQIKLEISYLYQRGPSPLRRIISLRVASNWWVVWKQKSKELRTSQNIIKQHFNMPPPSYTQSRLFSIMNYFTGSTPFLDYFYLVNTYIQVHFYCGKQEHSGN